MNYLPVASWGIYGSSTTDKAHSAAVSWGLLEDAPASTGFNIWVLVSNAWKKVSSISVLVSNAWKTVIDLKILITSWKDV